MKEVTGKITIYTYSYLFHSAQFSFQDGLQKEQNADEGGFFNYMNTIILTGFTLEAYLNHCGKELIDYWEYIERISILDKIKVISEHSQVYFDISKRPYQTIKKIIKLRNQLAHARTEHLEGQIRYKSDIELHTKGPKPEWEKHCNKNSVKLFLDDTEEFIKKYHIKIFKSEYPFFSFGHGFYG